MMVPEELVIQVLAALRTMGLEAQLIVAQAARVMLALVVRPMTALAALLTMALAAQCPGSQAAPPMMAPVGQLIVVQAVLATLVQVDLAIRGQVGMVVAVLQFADERPMLIWF